MEKKKLEKKIEDWAANLGFCLPDGSSPPPNFFAALTATPNRRNLWEILVESIQEKKRVEYVRKQLLVYQLKNKKKNVVNRANKNFNSKLELWEKQNELEVEKKKEKKICTDLETNIFLKSSDLLFEVSKMEELEKQCTEWKNKAFSLNLFNRRAKRIVEDFDEITDDSEIKNTFVEKLHQINLPEELKILGEKLSEGSLCNYFVNSEHECALQDRIRAIRNLGITEDLLWDESLKQKKIVFEEFLNKLNCLSSSEKILREKEEAIKKDLHASAVKLQKEILEKAMQIMINEAQGRFLDSDIEKLMGNVEMLILKSSPDRNLSCSLPYITQEEIDKSFSFKQKSIDQIKKYVNEIGRKNYCDFLKQELSKVEVKLAKAREECLRQNNSEKNLEEISKSIKSTFDEMWNLKSQYEGLEKSITDLTQKRLEIMASSPEKDGIEKTIEKLGGGLLRQVELFLEIPLDALKNAENDLKMPFHANSDSGGTVSKCFWTKLNSFNQNKESFAKEMEKRKKMEEEIKKFIAAREKLSDMQKKIFSCLSSISYDAKMCEANSRECDAILSAIQFRVDELITGIPFIEKILKKWLEQPYRNMISDSVKVNGKTLKEYEQLCVSDKNGKNP